MRSRPTPSYPRPGTSDSGPPTLRREALPVWQARCTDFDRILGRVELRKVKLQQEVWRSPTGQKGGDRVRRLWAGLCTRGGSGGAPRETARPGLYPVTFCPGCGSTSEPLESGWVQLGRAHRLTRLNRSVPSSRQAQSPARVLPRWSATRSPAGLQGALPFPFGNGARCDSPILSTAPSLLPSSRLTSDCGQPCRRR